MEDMNENFKLIMIVGFISLILGALIFGGYNLYILLTQNDNDNVEDFQGDMITSIDNGPKLENNDKINREDNILNFNMSDISNDSGFKINNDNPINKGDQWEKRTIKYSGTGHSIMYYIPKDWEQDTVVTDKKDGVRIGAKSFKIDDLSKETTFEEFLNRFVKTKEETEFSPEEVKNYTQRATTINGQEFHILVKDEYYNTIKEYFCLSKDGYAYYLEMSVSKQNYTQQLITTVDEIFATFRVD